MQRRHAVPVLSALILLAACARHSGNVAGSIITTEPAFETRSELLTNVTLHADEAVADLNGDGDLDLAVIGLDGTLQIMLGGNAATFAAGQTLQLGGVPIWITHADFDGDGDEDLVVVRTEADRTTVLRNDGNANFTVLVDLPVGAEALAVVAGDANDDGRLDLIVSQPVSPEIQVFLGDGAGGFTPGSAFVLPGGGVPFTMAIGEVTHDNRVDLVVSDPQQGRILIYAGSGSYVDFDPVPSILPVAGAPKAVSIGDLDADGFNDVAVSAFDAAQIVVIHDPEGTGNQRTVVQLPAPPSLSVIGDVTGDDRPDLVACMFSRASMVVVPQLANGTLGPAFQLDASGLPLRPFVGDFDRNDQNDLIVLSGLGDRINLWLADSTGRLAGARNYESTLPSAAFVAGGDFDGDGRNDVATGGRGATRVVVMTTPAAGGLEAAASFDVGRPVFNVRAADLDGDGKPDLVVPVQGGVKLLHNTSNPGNLAFTLVPAGNDVLAPGEGPFGVAAADLNRDGKLDLVVADFRNGQLTTLLAGAAPLSFDPQPQVIQLGGGPADVAAADFTGDGVLDIAVSRFGQSDIAILRNDGQGRLEPLVNLPVGEAPNYLVTADFNRDGRADLVVSNGNDASVTVLFSRGASFESARFPAGDGPTALLARDLTDDNIPDILVASLVAGDFRVLAGDGRGGFPALFPFPGTLGATGAVLQDMDGDQRADLLIGSQITTRVSLVHNISQER